MINQSDDSDSFYLISDGEVEVLLEYAGQRRLICRMGPGEFFGELAALTGLPRSAFVLTIVDSRFGVIKREAFLKCLSERPSLWQAITQQLVYTIHNLTEKVSLSTLDAYSRIRYHLYYMADEVDGNLVIEGHWTRLHIAQLTGCARETVTRIMKDLSRGEWISCERNRIVIRKTLPHQY